MARSIQQESTRPAFHLRLCLILILAALFSAPAHSQQPSQQTAPQTPAKKTRPVPPRITSHVILISISGFRSDYLSERYKNELAIPFLRGLREKGANIEGIESVYPSLSGPAHATMLTGMLPADHGITADDAFSQPDGAQVEKRDSLAREIKGETILQAAQRSGLTTMVSGFPLTGAAQARPAADSRQNNKTRLAQAVSTDQERAATAASAIEKKKPDLTLICLESLEETQRQFGPLSKESFATLARIDDLIKQIAESCDRAGIAGDATFLIVAPYGSAAVENELSPNAILAKKKLLTTDGQGRITDWQAVAQPLGGAAAIFVKNPNDEKLISAVEAAFREYHEKPHSPIWRMISRRDISRLGADARAVLYLDAAPMYVMSGRAGGDIKSKTDLRAASGYLPQRYEMRGAMIVTGKGIKPGARVEFARLADLAPTLARLLGMEMKAMRGRVISEMLTP